MGFGSIGIPQALGKSSLQRAVDRHPARADGEETGSWRSGSVKTEDETLLRGGRQFMK